MKEFTVRKGGHHFFVFPVFLRYIRGENEGGHIFLMCGRGVRIFYFHRFPYNYNSLYADFQTFYQNIVCISIYTVVGSPPGFHIILRRDQDLLVPAPPPNSGGTFFTGYIFPSRRHGDSESGYIRDGKRAGAC